MIENETVIKLVPIINLSNIKVYCKDIMETFGYYTVARFSKNSCLNHIVIGFLTSTKIINITNRLMCLFFFLFTIVFLLKLNFEQKDNINYKGYYHPSFWRSSVDVGPQRTKHQII